jgi:flavin reductase (DIM6/NTAB) family NADH-FMN oxidoreductase RutF
MAATMPQPVREFYLEVEDSKLRDVMSRYITGVAVVTTPREDAETGVTVNSFTSVSLEPPTVLVCLHAGGRVAAAVARSGCYAINILSGSQAGLARRFATPGLDDEARFRWLELNHAVTGSPLLAGVAAWLDCRVQHSVTVGTHEIFIGTVLAAGVDIAGEAPLIYHQRALGPLR